MKNLFFLFVVITTSLFCQDVRERLGFERVDNVKMNQLVGMSYYGALRLGYGAGEYLNDGFGVSNKEANRQNTTWITTQGTYGLYHGYWIFKPNIRQCWTVNFGYGHPGDKHLDFWNKDGRGQTPENYEMFLFEFADSSHCSVVIRNICGPYVRYDSSHFVCDADRGSAAVFFPEFD